MWTEWLLIACLVSFFLFEVAVFCRVNGTQVSFVVIGTVLVLGLVSFSFRYGRKVGIREGKQEKEKKNDDSSQLGSASPASKRVSELRPSLRLRPRGDSGLGLRSTSTASFSSVPSPPPLSPTTFTASTDPSASSFERFRARTPTSPQLRKSITSIASVSPGVRLSSASGELAVTPLMLAAAAEMKHDASISEARVLLKQILGTEGGDRDLAGLVPWRLIRSGTSTLLWASRNKSDAILLKGLSQTMSSPAAVTKWLLDQNLAATGLEGISKTVEATQLVGPGVVSVGATSPLSATSKIYIRRIHCKSGSILASRRDLLVVTTVHYLPDGAYMIASRSVEDDFRQQSTSRGKPQSQSAKILGLGALVSGETRRRELVRGLLHCSGWLLVPRPQLSGDLHCDISFAVHLDLLGSARTNQSRIDPLAKSLLATCARLQTRCADDYEPRPHETVAAAESAASALRQRRHSAAACMLNSDDDFLGLDIPDSPTGTPVQRLRKGSLATASSTPTQSHLPWSCADSCGEEEMDGFVTQQLLAAVGDAATQLCELHTSFQLHLAEQESGGGVASAGDISLPTSPYSSLSAAPTETPPQENWTVFSRQGGVLVGELSRRGKAAGILAASCTIHAAPSAIRSLLLERPDAVDGLLEVRAVLKNLDEDTFVQWLAYRSIWPVGARDFLLVTTVLDKPDGGFALCSTSADAFVEDFDDSNEDSPLQGYTRSSLKIAGYVGTATPDGTGTCLTVIFQVDFYELVPGWLVQLLAQFGLSEMLQRIRQSLCKDPSPSGSLQSLADWALGGSFVGDNNEAVKAQGESQIDRLLKQLEEQEERPNQALQPALKQFLTNTTNSNILNQPPTVTPGPDNIEGTDSNGQAVVASVSVGERGSRGEGLTLQTDGDGLDYVEETPKHPASANHATLPANLSPRSLLMMESTPKTRPWLAESSGVQLVSEARQLMLIYLGLENDPAHPLMAQLGIEWQEKGRKDKTRVYACSFPGNPWRAVKSITSFQASLEDILALLLDDTRIQEFDEIFDNFQPILRLDTCTNVRRLIFKGIWPSAPRDFVVMTTCFRRPDGSAIIASRSATNELEPPVAGFVRGFTQVTGYYVQPYETLSESERAEFPGLASGGCKVTGLWHSELGGTLPASLINMLAVNAPLKMLHAMDCILAQPKKR